MALGEAVRRTLESEGLQRTVGGLNPEDGDRGDRQSEGPYGFRYRAEYVRCKGQLALSRLDARWVSDIVTGRGLDNGSSYPLAARVLVSRMRIL
ncbi:MAG: hypothetical protein CL484_08280 [Acidobacteria bacterium]|nr:hypothetical protein [Acidobacteriota bacterium]